MKRTSNFIWLIIYSVLLSQVKCGVGEWGGRKQTKMPCLLPFYSLSSLMMKIQEDTYSQKSQTQEFIQRKLCWEKLEKKNTMNMNSYRDIWTFETWRNLKGKWFKMVRQYLEFIESETTEELIFNKVCYVKNWYVNYICFFFLIYSYRKNNFICQGSFLALAAKNSTPNLLLNHSHYWSMFLNTSFLIFHIFFFNCLLVYRYFR